MKKIFLLLGIMLVSTSLFAKEYLISGKVTDENGKPLTGIEIVATKGSMTQKYFTNLTGEYSLNLEEDTYKIYFQIYDYIYIFPDKKEIKIKVKKDAKYDFQLNLDSFKLNQKAMGIGKLRGKVYDENGKPVVGAEIRVIGTDCKTNVSDSSNGKYEILNIPDGEHRVMATCIGKEFQIKDVKILKYGGVSNLNFVLIKDTNKIDTNGIFYPMGERYSEEGGFGDYDEMEFASDASVSKSMKRPMAIGLASEEAMSGGIDMEEIGSSVPPTSSAQAGTLTSGEVNDFRKWDMWNDVSEEELSEFREVWEMNTTNRYTVQLVNSAGNPVVDAKVYLKNKNNEIIWQARSDNTGKAELWANIYNYEKIEDYIIETERDGNTETIEDAHPFKEGVNIIQTDWLCDNHKNLDILFAVDATGSMGDEIEYLQAELNDIITRVKENNKELEVRLGSLFYRDKRERYLVTKTPLSTDINQTLKFINSQHASGGGDYPEAVEVAMETAVNGFEWSEDAAARLMFLILDAPAHEDEKTLKRLHEITARLAMEGIRVIPVACSGIERETEFLMRSTALATNGTYVFLTDDSGIGNDHLEPITDSYEVEKMNDLFIRLIGQFAMIPNCENPELTEKEISENVFNKGDEVKPKTEDISKLMICYPNPTNGIFTMDLKTNIDELYLIDIAGKIIRRMENLNKGKHQINISEFPNGVYFIKFMEGGQWGLAKILIQK